MFNATRSRSWLSFLLTFGVPGALALGVLLDRRRFPLADIGPLLTGLAMSLLLFAYAMLTAWADGRFAWAGYPFTIPLAMLVLHRNPQELNRN